MHASDPEAKESGGQEASSLRLDQRKRRVKQGVVLCWSEAHMDAAQKDPVCGMNVLLETGLSLIFQERTVFFCSEYCRTKFQQNPKRYLANFVVDADEAKEHRRVAYFSMEVALDCAIPTYSGGLGVLAGDMLKACADLRVPVIGISMLWRKGYWTMRLPG
jgi:starch phosphorylase